MINTIEWSYHSKHHGKLSSTYRNVALRWSQCRNVPVSYFVQYCHGKGTNHGTLGRYWALRIPFTGLDKIFWIYMGDLSITGKLKGPITHCVIIVTHTVVAQCVSISSIVRVRDLLAGKQMQTLRCGYREQWPCMFSRGYKRQGELGQGLSYFPRPSRVAAESYFFQTITDPSN